MKHATEYAPKIKRLSALLKKEGAGPAPPEVEEPMDQLLMAILSTYASEARAHAAMTKLRTSVVDLNELRVTPIAEVVEVIGSDYPMCRSAAEEICSTLISIFNRKHSLDLEFLRKAPRKTTETFLNSLNGLRPHARAYFVLRSGKGGPIPIDAHMYAYLQKSGNAPMELDVEGVHKLMAHFIKESDAAYFYSHLKKYAALHAPKKWPEAKPAPITPPPAPIKGAPVPPPKKGDKVGAGASVKLQKKADPKGGQAVHGSKSSKSRDKVVARKR